MKAVAFLVGLPRKDESGGEVASTCGQKQPFVWLWQHLVLQLVELGMGGDTHTRSQLMPPS